MSLFDRVPVIALLALAATLGLAPFVPEPHVWQKLKMLAGGTLVRPVDIFDLVLHGTPWGLLGVKLWRLGSRGRGGAS